MSSFSRISSITGISSFAASAGGGGGGGGDVTPNAVNWSNITYDELSDNPEFTGQQITGIDSSIVLQLNLSPEGSALGVTWGNNAQGFTTYPPCPGCVLVSTSGYTFSVSNNQYVYFGQFGLSDGTVVTVRNVSDSNAILDTFTCFYNAACLLTSAVVNYKGLSDDGPELTAMRSLRNHYKNNPGYDQILSEYKQTSSLIIYQIRSSNTESIEYEYIYDTVIQIMNHVNAEEWQQAHDLYMAMYEDLKSRYLGA